MFPFLPRLAAAAAAAAAALVVVVVVVDVVDPLLLPPPQNSFQSLASEPDSVSATRISLIASSSSFIFFPAIAIDTYNGLPYYTTLHDWHSLGT